MDIEIRVEEVIKTYCPNIQAGRMQSTMAKDLRVHRHTIGKLFRNEFKNPPLDLLGKVCDWLVERGVPASELPGALFKVRLPSLLLAVQQRKSVAVYLGEYREIDDPNPVRRWISRRDSEVASDLFHHLTHHLGEPSVIVNFRYVPFRYTLRGDKVSDAQFEKEDIANSYKMFEDMRGRESQEAAILIGSQRANLLVEHLVANLFGCTPFEPPKRRIRVPFYFLYREGSSHPERSCFGGFDNPPGRTGEPVSGLYYLDARGKWQLCGWERHKKDAGLIITVYDGELLQLAVLGFSGHGTVTAGKLLRTATGDQFWAERVKMKGKEVGVYVCPVEFEEPAAAEQADTEDACVLKAGTSKPFALDERVLRKYLRVRPAAAV